jgi:hypothetical protein
MCESRFIRRAFNIRSSYRSWGARFGTMGSEPASANAGYLAGDISLVCSLCAFWTVRI